jgi:ribosome-associated protein
LDVVIKGEYITLGQLLKLVGEVDSGGQIKPYLEEQTPLVNGQPENRRGRKLRAGDVIELAGAGTVSCIAATED